jgi:hypothetical protein
MLIRPTWSVHTGVHALRDRRRVPGQGPVCPQDPRKGFGPWRAAFRRGAHQALELPAGECERLGIQVGDRLAWGSLEPDA